MHVKGVNPSISGLDPFMSEWERLSLISNT